MVGSISSVHLILPWHVAAEKKHADDQKVNTDAVFDKKAQSIPAVEATESSSLDLGHKGREDEQAKERQLSTIELLKHHNASLKQTSESKTVNAKKALSEYQQVANMIKPKNP